VFARTARSDALDAHLASVALASGRVPLAERFLRQRADEWRSLSAVEPLLMRLSQSSAAAADSIVSIATRGRASRLERARLLLAAGAWSERSHDLLRARGHYERALEMTADTVVVSDVLTRLGLMEVRNAATIADAQSHLDRTRRQIRRPALASADTTLRLVTRLATVSDTTGASLFLAAELARDALGARRLASALFREVGQKYPASSLAPKAALAIADLWPDSATALRSKVRADYATSPYVQLLDGKPVTSPLLDQDNRLLRQAWARLKLSVDSASVASERPRP
jgi:hypothetical protein